ncbi:MAG: VacJ family lipoprotein [Betaproteobacteria bacterium]|nr:VacJ family lipoprotein [Betaproteobacteria bacterium]
MTLSAARFRTALVLGLLSLTLFAGCASTNNPRDPLEPLNRAVYQFNDALDKVVMKPVATVYREVLPDFARTGVTNFFNNLYDILTALNSLLQGKIADAASDVGRIAVNTTLGLAGLIDFATEVGLEKHKEDFGQTLGRWGIGDGPYLQVPFFGPSSFRDVLGAYVDFRVDPIRWIWRDHMATRNSLWGLYFVNLRASLLDSTKILEEAALDPYEFQRDAYLQRRRNLVYDGNPPPQKEEDELPELKTKPRTELDEPGKPSGAAFGAQQDLAAEAAPAEGRAPAARPAI